MSEPLTLLVWRACRDIDVKVSEIRERYISDPTGQQRVYEAKLAEAHALLAALPGNSAAQPGPYLMAEAARRGKTWAALAAEVVAAAAAYEAASPLIEAERVGGKDDVRAAADAEGVESARLDCLAALEALAPGA